RERDVRLPGAPVTRGQRGHAGPVTPRDERVTARRDVAEPEAAAGVRGRGRDLGADLVGQRHLSRGERLGPAARAPPPGRWPGVTVPPRPSCPEPPARTVPARPLPPRSTMSWLVPAPGAA